jgi:hypothetical protein
MRTKLGEGGGGGGGRARGGGGEGGEGGEGGGGEGGGSVGGVGGVDSGGEGGGVAVVISPSSPTLARATARLGQRQARLARRGDATKLGDQYPDTQHAHLRQASHSQEGDDSVAATRLDAYRALRLCIAAERHTDGDVRHARSTLSQA